LEYLSQIAGTERDEEEEKRGIWSRKTDCCHESCKPEASPTPLSTINIVEEIYPGEKNLVQIH
jgi:hypothetical protein